jgi:hypothetical protein
MKTSQKLLFIALATFLTLTARVTTADTREPSQLSPAASDKKGQVDCFSTPKGGLGNVSFILIACFEELELRLNALMASSVNPPPFDQFDLSLIDLHKRATEKVARALRGTIERVLRQGNADDRQQLATFETNILEGLVLDEATTVIALMRVADTQPDGGNKGGEKDKGKELEDEIKKIIEETLKSRFIPEWVTNAFKIIDSIVKYLVKT